MNYQEMFRIAEDCCPSDPSYNNDFHSYQPKMMDYQQLPPGAIAESYQGNVARPPMYNLDGYISPYSYENWGASTKFLSFLEEESRLPMMETKLDPNKIFNSDIAALRTSAADQLKITRAFERKLLKSLNGKENQELTENDIQAMQAITASRNSIISANNGQVAIKKNIADIKLKQANNKTMQNNTGAITSGGTGGAFDAAGIGKSILDGLMDVDMKSLELNNVDQGFEMVSDDEAASLINSMSSNSNDDIAFENMGAKTYVIPAPDGSYMYETYDKSGNIIPEYKNPTTMIDNVDLESGFAQDIEMNQYPLKIDSI